MAQGGKEAIRVDEEVVGSSEINVLEKRIRELERVLGKMTLENEILREVVKEFFSLYSRRTLKNGSPSIKTLWARGAE